MSFSDGGEGGGGGGLATRSRSRGGAKSPISVPPVQQDLIKDLRRHSLAHSSPKAAPHGAATCKGSRTDGSNGMASGAGRLAAPMTCLSTSPRFLSYGPSCDDDLDDHHSTETQSSLKTISLLDHRQRDRQHSEQPVAAAPPTPSSSNSSSNLFLPHIAFSFLILALLSFSSSFLLPPYFLPSLKHKLSSLSPSLASSHQLLELRTFLTLSLQTTTDRLEEQVHELKLEMLEDTRRRHLELQSIREELSKHIINNPPESEDSASSTKKVAMPTHGIIVAERPDYALGSGGGRVLEHSPVFQPISSKSWREKVYNYFGGRPQVHPLASVILQPGFNQPGQCLPLAGSSDVYIVIALRIPIFPDQVILTHVSKAIAYDISSAPKDFHIYGAKTTPMSTGKPSSSWILLGEFTYDIEGDSPVQAFNLYENAKDIPVSTIKLHVLSNYGSPSHTCIYRLQVHGQKPTS